MTNAAATPPGRRQWVAAALLFLLLALLTRGPLLGNPVIHIDEQFYLLVGDRMLHGALPYVDIWDRKPLGLFLLYGLMSAVGNAPVYQYQIAALLAAASTSLVLYCIARSVASHRGALTAGIAYLLYLLACNGAGGQSPVFYNLLVGLAALGTMRTVTRRADHALVARGVAIMLLTGVAIQIKYTVVFEGAFFGLALMWKHWSDRRSAVSLAATGLLWATCALVPTFLALAYYAAIGQEQAFLQANFLSIFGRGVVWSATLKRLLATTALLLPLWWVIPRSKAVVAATNAAQKEMRFLCFWGGAAVAGYLLFGSYYDHYAIPLLLPLAALAAPAFALPGRKGLLRSALALVVSGIVGAALVLMHVRQEGSAQQLERLTESTRPQLKGGCLYVYEGPPMLYETTGACIATRFVFPSHLNNEKEHYALGTGAEAAMRELLARRPAVIVMADKPLKPNFNAYTRTVLRQALKSDYELFGRQKLGTTLLLTYRRVDNRVHRPVRN